jgi:uncharacterized protein involved in type VI secretion and phage assembly
VRAKTAAGRYYPRSATKVLVAFEQGDVRRPTVIGGLFNGVDTMPSGPVDLVDGWHRADQSPVDGLPVGSSS